MLSNHVNRLLTFMMNKTFNDTKHSTVLITVSIVRLLRSRERVGTLKM